MLAGFARYLAFVLGWFLCYVALPSRLQELNVCVADRPNGSSSVNGVESGVITGLDRSRIRNTALERMSISSPRVGASSPWGFLLLFSSLDLPHLSSLEFAALPAPVNLTSLLTRCVLPALMKLQFISCTLTASSPPPGHYITVAKTAKLYLRPEDDPGSLVLNWELPGPGRWTIRRCRVEDVYGCQLGCACDRGVPADRFVRITGPQLGLTLPLSRVPGTYR